MIRTIILEKGHDGCGKKRLVARDEYCSVRQVLGRAYQGRLHHPKHRTKSFGSVHRRETAAGLFGNGREAGRWRDGQATNQSEIGASDGPCMGGWALSLFLRSTRCFFQSHNLSNGWPLTIDEHYYAMLPPYQE